MIFYTKHAKDKFEILKRHSFEVTKDQVEKAVTDPDLVDYSRRPLLIGQIGIDKDHVLRVVYKGEDDVIKIITFYPGRFKQYEK